MPLLHSIGAKIQNILDVLTIFNNKCASRSFFEATVGLISFGYLAEFHSHKRNNARK